MKRARALSNEAKFHAEWLGMLQPDGLVLSVPVLEDTAVFVRHGAPVQEAFRLATPEDALPDLATLARWLDWPERFRDAEKASSLAVDLPDLGATLRADLALVDGDAVLALVQWAQDDPDDPGDARWPTSTAERFERLLTARGVPVGVLVWPDAVRLVYAPAGEAPGRLTFPVTAMRAADGRVLVDALQTLLGAQRLWNAPAGKSLRELLVESRKRQEQVTNELAEQVEDALRTLVRGFDTANGRTNGALLQGVEPSQVYDGLTTVMLRLVFLLYAEDRGLLPVDHPLYEAHYSVLGLAERLIADRVAYAEAMDRRFGAWARLCAVFRLAFTGARHRDLQIPPRQGDLFDPGRHPFLEGRVTSNWRQDRANLPPIDDGVIADVLDRLIHLGGQRISYRNLEIEQIGSVYEALMGFEVRRVAGPAVLLRSGVVVELPALRVSDDRVRTLADALDEKPAKVTARVPELAAFRLGEDVGADFDRLRAALAPLSDADAPPIVAGDHYLQPGEERRRTGSHYTPRSLTEPIVAKTLGPVLDRDGPPTPADILALKVCDPAMGSGAFLAEACRYLARRLVEAWARTNTTPVEARKGNAELVARRAVAERCLYGVDKNPRAVQLARLSLWLVTSARELPFTFVDHALKEGDALIGLDLQQASSFSFDRKGDAPLWTGRFESAMASAARTRAKISERQQELRFVHDQQKTYLQMADEEVWDERRVADLIIAAAWPGGSAKDVNKRLARLGGLARAWYPNEARDPLPEEGETAIAALDEAGLRPFHWWMEFPEVFQRKTSGFDAVIGNPPFGGKNTISATSGAGYIPLLRWEWPHAHGNADLASYFFLRATSILRPGGCFGLVATNTIAQGNTRETGLQHLVNDGGVVLYEAIVDMPWPVGGAAVIVDVVHGCIGKWTGPFRLGGNEVSGLSSALTAGEELGDPVPLAANDGKGFIGSYVLGMGFTLTPAEAAAHISREPRNAEIVKPYIGGQELNSSPDLAHERFVIDFGDRTLAEAEQWPELLSIVRTKVKPERDAQNRESRQRYWWHFAEKAPNLYRAIAPLQRCLVCARVSKHLMFAFQPADRVLSEATVVFAYDDWYTFGLLQSWAHQHWVHQPGLASSMKMDLRYTPSTCFATFPFPNASKAKRNVVGTAGEALYNARFAIMQRDRIGMTKVWNRLLDPDDQEPDIVELRRLRDAMDRAVLDAYGWSDLAPTDKDAIVTRLRKLNAQRAAAEKRGT